MRSVLVLILSCIICVAVLQALAQADYECGQVIRLSLLFYEAQRSGVLPSDNRIVTGKIPC